MKLFVWDDPVHVAYGGCVVVVMAETVEQAREIAAAGHGWQKWNYEGNDIDPIRKRGLAGEPTAVLDGPAYAASYWSE